MQRQVGGVQLCGALQGQCGAGVRGAYSGVGAASGLRGGGLQRHGGGVAAA